MNRMVGVEVNELRIYTNDEYKANLRKELEENGLYESIRERLDAIDVLSSELRWLKYAYIQEMMREILDLVEMR